MKRLLPLGSIIMVESEGETKLMIIGRLIKKEVGDETIWDYCACKAPTGVSDDSLAFFNHEQISRLLFIGYQDEEELQYSYACKRFDKNTANQK